VTHKLKVITAILALTLCNLDGQGVGPSDLWATEPEGSNAAKEAYFGARFKEGKGVELAPEMRTSLGLETAEVAEGEISSQATVDMQVFAVSPAVLATGLVRQQQTAALRIGDSVLLERERGSATLTRLTPTTRAGELEGTFVVAAYGETPKVGESVVGLIPHSSGEAGAVIPASALLETVSGHFVYVENGSHFLRTAVTVGRSGGDRIEITDGLYPGDVVVKTPVRSLWYAELQALRGGKACADGH
jgi:hypothetical protein